MWRRLLHGNFGHAWAAAASRRGRGLPPINYVSFGARAAREAKPSSNARMILDGFCDKIILAGFAAKTQAQVAVADKAEPAPTIRTAVFRLGHDTSLRSGGCSRLATEHICRCALPLDFRAINVWQYSQLPAYPRRF
jgi:hypothetical protein